MNACVFDWMNKRRKKLVWAYFFHSRDHGCSIAHPMCGGVRQIEKLATVFCMTYKGLIRL